jgi:outer membrane protein assembly factor BamD
MMKLRYGIAFAASCLLINACSSIKDPADEFKNQSAEQIFHGGEQALAKGNYSTAARHYEGLDSLYPFSAYSEQAMLDSIYAYYQNGDYASSEAAAARFIHTFPASAHVDYALYMKAVSESVEDKSWPQRYNLVDTASRDAGSSKRAFSDFAVLTAQYPESAYSPDARLRMINLRNMFAQKELELAGFYYERHDYVAASNRAAGVLEHFEGTPAQEGALAIMVKSYRALDLPQEANKALQTLTLNFPHSQYLRSINKVYKLH